MLIIRLIATVDEMLKGQADAFITLGAYMPAYLCAKI